MNYEANIPRGSFSTSREFPIPFRTRSSSHTPECNCPDPDGVHTYSSPPLVSRASSSTPSMASKDAKPKESYFSSLNSIKTDDEHSSSESESNDDTSAEKAKDANLNNKPTAGESKNNTTDLPNQGASTSNFAKLFAYGVIGMTIDYNGDILDSSKRSYGKASGDITEMVGQKIDEDGLIRSTAGEVVGQVAQNYGLQEAVAAMLEIQKKMGDDGSRETKFGENKERSGSKTGAQEGSKGLPNIWQGTVGEGPPGNDIHLNVQSTKEGISMSIRIPTMFMKEQHRQFEEEKKRKAEEQST